MTATQDRINQEVAAEDEATCTSVASCSVLRPMGVAVHLLDSSSRAHVARVVEALEDITGNDVEPLCFDSFRLVVAIDTSRLR